MALDDPVHWGWFGLEISKHPKPFSDTIDKVRMSLFEFYNRIYHFRDE